MPDPTPTPRLRRLRSAADIASHRAGPKKPAPTSAADAAAAESAVGPSNRNGYARVMGRIADLMAGAPARSRPRISIADERQLRDGDERQLGPAGVTIASLGSNEQWRTFVRDHVRRRFDLFVLFDARSMSLK
jgi:hypothetical protein